MAIVLGGAALLVGSGAMSALLNASSGILGVWSNGKLSEEVVTTGVGPPVEPVQTGTAVQPVSSRQTAAPIQATEASSAPRDVRKPQTKVRAKPVRRARTQERRPNDEARRARADARTERLWKERAAEIGRRSPRNDIFRPAR